MAACTAYLQQLTAEPFINMSALSRGLLMWPRCASIPKQPTTFFSPFQQLQNQLINPQLQSFQNAQSRSVQHSRAFSSSIILRSAIKKPAKPPRPSTIPKQTPSSQGRLAVAPVVAKTASYGSYATILSQKPMPTLLYAAPPHIVFLMTCYAAGLFCLAYAAYSFWTYWVQSRPDLPFWVPYAFSGISLMMAVLGGWLIAGPARIVQTITAIPTKLATISSAVGNSGRQPSLQIEITVRKMLPLPFLSARKIYVQPHEITIPMALGPVEKRRLAPEEAREKARKERIAQEEYWEYERSHVMTSYFRHPSQQLYEIFVAFRRMFWREGFMKIVVKGKGAYKLDVTGGWSLDKGKALDRLVTRRSG